MSLLMRKTPLTFVREATGSWNTSGRWVEGLPSDIECLGSLQPYRAGESQIKLPEGVQAKDMRIFYTKTKLNPTNQFAKSRADYTTIDGYEFEVFDVEDWKQYDFRSDHYKVILVRRDLDTARGL